MPIYVYQCDKCKVRTEVYQSYSEKSLTVCPECKQEELRKVYNPMPVHYLGKGFYSTDNKAE